jgi:hypothetical protein
MRLSASATLSTRTRGTVDIVPLFEESPKRDLQDELIRTSGPSRTIGMSSLLIPSRRGSIFEGMMVLVGAMILMRSAYCLTVCDSQTGQHVAETTLICDHFLRHHHRS